MLQNYSAGLQLYEYGWVQIILYIKHVAGKFEIAFHLIYFMLFHLSFDVFSENAAVAFPVVHVARRG